jgi:MYXO-CTERM domain-containing protein
MNRFLTLAAFAFVAVGVVGCDPYANYCAKMKQCHEDDEEGYDYVGLGSDYEAVCYEELKGGERVLRANSEPECDVAADGYRNLYGCLAWLDCQDLRKEDYGGECKEERAALEDANEDAEGECQSAIVACSTSATPAPMVALVVVLYGLARVRRRVRGG